MFRKSSFLAVALAAVALFTVVFAACGDDDDDSASSGAASNGSTQWSAAAFIDNAGLHGIDESLNTDKTVPATAAATALKVAAVIRNTEWESADKAAADKLAQTLADLSTALSADPVDMTKAGQLAHDAHEGAHEFTHAIWDEQYKKAGLKAGDDGDHE